MNTNCLEGMRCPKCGSEGAFEIVACATVTMTDEGSEGVRDIEWENKASCHCIDCDYHGIVSDFRIQGLTVRELMKILEHSDPDDLVLLSRTPDADDVSPLNYIDTEMSYVPDHESGLDCKIDARQCGNTDGYETGTFWWEGVPCVLLVPVN